MAKSDLNIHLTAEVNGRETDKETLAQNFLDLIFPDRSIKKVLLVNPPDADGELFSPEIARRGRYANYPAYGLAVLAQHLRNMGIEACIINLNNDILKACAKSESFEISDFESTWRQVMDDSIAKFQPDLIGVTCMFTMTHSSFKVVCEHVATTGIPLAIGGVHVSNDVERVLNQIPGASFAFIREGDLAIRSFINVVNRKASIDQLGQILFNDSANDTRLRFDHERIPSVDDTSIVPAFDLLDMSDHSEYGTVGAFFGFKPEGTPMATVLSNRGCRAQCTFCSVRNFNGPGVRMRSVESVVDELEILEKKFGIEHIMWLDDDLFRDTNRTIELFEEISHRNLKMTWDATNGVIAASCVEEIIEAAAASGCIAINIGMESGNAEILRKIRKPGTVETFLKAATVLRNHDSVHTSVFLMLGFPGETMSMIMDTINVAREMDLDWYRISMLQPLPNTPIYDDMVEEGLVQPVGDNNLRYMAGPYGKQAEIERGEVLTTANFEQAFRSIPLDAVPDAEQLTDIWFYMNYYLNFHRLFSEERPVKIEQQFKNLKVIADIISPGNAFALYFLGYLQHKMYRKIDSEIIDRLNERLSTSDYWEDRFSAFGLSVEDLKTADFSGQTDPAVLTGNIWQQGI